MVVYQRLNKQKEIKEVNRQGKTEVCLLRFSNKGKRDQALPYLLIPPRNQYNRL